VKIFEPGSHIHFIGIAGSGMSGIAEILLGRGFLISGSDERESDTFHSLRKLGAKVYLGHRADQIAGAKYVVISSAISAENAELVAARTSGVEVMRRADALARLLPGKFSIAVAGTHGKTTTSGMFAQALDDLGRAPSFVIGSKISALGVSARDGVGDEFVVEADESDGSFLEYRPSAVIITNIELDHVDNFQSLDQVRDLFTQFANTARDLFVFCADDRNARSLEVPNRLRRISYGEVEGSDLRVKEISERGMETISRLTFRGEELGSLRLTIPGKHNVLNAAAVIATAIGMGFSPKDVISTLEKFAGTARRFEIKGEVEGITVIDDYGHHPTEIRATLTAARTYLKERGAGRLAVIFQPHRHSRTKEFLNEFAESLSAADRTIVMDIYSAGEQVIPGISSEEIAKKASGAIYLPGRESVIDEVKRWAKPGDLVLTLGAGDVTELGPLIIAAFSKTR
jgi:UDP-N-acetylmuramate--alanine ligase